MPSLNIDASNVDLLDLSINNKQVTYNARISTRFDTRGAQNRMYKSGVSSIKLNGVATNRNRAFLHTYMNELNTVTTAASIKVGEVQQVQGGSAASVMDICDYVVEGKSIRLLTVDVAQLRCDLVGSSGIFHIGAHGGLILENIDVITAQTTAPSRRLLSTTNTPTVQVTSALAGAVSMKGVRTDTDNTKILAASPSLTCCQVLQQHSAL